MGQVEGKSKIEIARTVMSDMLAKLPADVQAGLMVYGHNRKDDCQDIEVVAPVGSERSALIQKLGAINPKGMTPLTESVRLAAAQFQQQEGAASVVVVSDGQETCAGDPCIAAREATGAGVNLRIHVIGFDVTPEETAQLTCIAEEGKGKYFSAANAERLVTALSEVEKEVVAPTPPPAPAPAPDPNPGDDIIFEDHFEREELGELYELMDPDPERFALVDGQVLSVATQPRKNAVVLRQPIAGDFVATIKVTFEVGKDNFAKFSYSFDKQNFVQVWVGTQCCYYRDVYFSKTVGGTANAFELGHDAQLGGRELNGFSTQPEPWYFQIEKAGRKFIGRVGTDGVKWTDIGTHTVLKGGEGYFSFSAGSGGGIEREAAFDDFVVKRLK